MSCFKVLDNFGYTPQFLANGDTKYKTNTGGVASFIFILLALSYFVSQLLSFITTLDKVKSSRDVEIPSRKYNITYKDFYFGVGYIDNYRQEYNMSFISFLSVSIDYVTVFPDGSHTSQTVDLGSCEKDKLLPVGDFEQNYNTTQRVFILSKLNNYLCPVGNWTVEMYVPEFGGTYSYFQLIIKIKNQSLLNFASNFLSKYQLRSHIIYKNLYVDAEDRLDPYNSYISSFFNELDYNFIKITDVYLNPFEMSDDNNFFGNGDFTGVSSDYSDQLNETIFMPVRTYDYFTYIPDRSVSTVLNPGNPQLTVYKVVMNLDPMMKITYRTYPKFTEFLAGVTSILSSGLMVVAIIMVQYNSIHGTNTMIQALYSHQAIKNFRTFNMDLKSCIDQFNHSLRFKRLGKKLNSHKPISNMTVDLSCELLNKNPSNDNNVESKCLSKNEEKRYSELNRDQTVLRGEDSRSENLIRRDSKLERIIETLLEEYKEFSVVDYIKSKCHNQSKRILLYGFGLKNLQNGLDVENYLKMNLELSLIKEVIFDENQLGIFNTISSIIGFKKMFEEGEKKLRKLSDYSKVEFNDFFDSIVRLLSRRNNTDRKILSFINNQMTF